MIIILDILIRQENNLRSLPIIYDKKNIVD